MVKSNNNRAITRLIAVLLIIVLIYAPTGVYAEENSTSNITITLDPNGGRLTGVDIFTISDEQGYKYPNLSQYGTPVRTGHNFTGWFKNKSGGTAISEGDLSISTSHAIYAQWAPKQFTVIFNGKGGSVSKKSMSVTYGSEYGKLPTATKKGYGFIGWYTASGEKIASSTKYMTDGNTTLYAKWGKKIKLTFNANSGKVSKKSKYVTKGMKYGKLPVPKKSGYTFEGWYTKKSGGTKITSGKTVGLNKNTTLYARWTRTKHKITFNPMGGSVSKKSKKVFSGGKYGNLPTPKRKGYVFKGWYTKKTGGNKVTKNNKYKSSKDRTLYARWSAKKINIRFNANKGSVSKKSKSVKYNSKYGSLPKPKRKNYTFLGWYTKKSGGTKIISSKTVKYTKTKTLYAKWGKMYTLKFDYRNGQKGITSKKILYGKKYGDLPVSSRNNYVFKGWYTSKYGGTKVTSSSIVKVKKNSTLYAQWDWKMPIKEMLAPVGSKARSGDLLTGFNGVTIHNTGNSSKTADALNHGTYLQGSGSKKSASWHYCVDDSIAVRSIPENEKAWHAGDGGTGEGNSTTISIEICMNSGGDLLDATENGAKLAADILKRYGQTFAISNLNLHQHNFYSSYGKNCPEKIRGGNPYNWSTFINRVNYYLNQ